MATVMFKGDLRLLYIVNLMIGVCYIDIVNTVGRETPQSTQRIANSTMHAELMHCLLPIRRYNVNHHPKMLDFSQDPFLHLPVTWPTVMFALITAACLNTDAPTAAVTFLISQRFIAIMHAFVFRLLHWPEHIKTVSSVLLASQTGSIDFGADAFTLL